MKKTLALVLALLMMLTSMAAFAEEVDYYKKGGFDGLTFTQIGSAAQDLPEGQDLNHNFTKRYLELRLNIVPEYLWISNGDAYTTKLNSMIMTGDIPDMMEVSLAQYDQLVKSGLVADLTDILDTYLCPELKEAYAGAGNTDLAAVTRNGRIYGLPQTNGMGDGSPLFWIRKDWMEKLNLEAPKTYEDIANIARAFMTQDPDGDGQDNTYGLPIMPSYTATYGGEGNLGDLFLNNGGAAPGQWRLQEDGTVIYGGLMEGAKEALNLLNGWYNEGIIPSDFATWDSTTFGQAIAGGKAGICMGPW